MNSEHFFKKILLLCLLSACQTAPKTTDTSYLHEGALRVRQGDPRVGTYISDDSTFETSSYWIEGPTGLVMIDTQFLFSTATESIDWAERLTGKKVKLAIVLHPNPDKFNGVEVFQKRGIRVITSTQVAAEIPEVHKDRYKSFYSRYKPDYPTFAPVIDIFGNKTTTMTEAGVTFTMHVLGAGASAAHIAVEYDGHLFVGDLVANLHHSWLEIGKTDEWLKRIEELKKLEPAWVHPGRGPSSGAELLDREEAYLKDVVATVARYKPHGKPSTATKDKIIAELTNRYVGYGNDYFLEIGIPAEWARQAAKKK